MGHLRRDLVGAECCHARRAELEKSWLACPVKALAAVFFELQRVGDAVG